VGQHDIGKFQECFVLFESNVTI